MTRLGGAILWLLLIVGCKVDDTSTRKTQPLAVTSPVQRFVPLPANQQITAMPWTGFLALDTQTGELCRTSEIDIDGRFHDLASCYWLFEHVQPPDRVRIP